jgi:chaperonin cofactor prefoldin
VPDLFTDPQQLDQVQAQFSQLIATLHDLALSIHAAEQTGQTDAALQLRQQWRDVYARVNTLKAQLAGAEMPGPVATALADFSDQATTIAKSIGEGTAALAGNLSQAVGLLSNPVVVVGLVVVAVLVLYLLFRR